MSLSTMQVFNQYIMPAIIEMYPQEIQKFNAASAGTIVLNTEGFDGDFLEKSFYQAIHGSQRRVDRYATNADATATNLTQLQENLVKVAGGFGPITMEPSQFSWLRKPTQEGLTVVAQNFVEALLADQLNTGIAACVAALSNNSDVTYDYSATGQISQTVINSALALFGDRSQAIRALIMTGTQYHTLVGQAIDNSNSLFEIGGVAVRDGTAFGQGRPIIITDADALRDDTNSYQHVLGLTAGGVMVKDNGDIITNVETTNGKERIETTFQADYSFGLGLKGYSWDETNGGASPTDTEIQTGSNWDQSVSSIKDTAGVIAIGQE